MLAAVEKALPADAAVFAAAVADWRVAEAGEQKIKKTAGGAPKLALVENPDILATIAKRKTLRPRLVVGFAAETEHVIENARAKRERKGCDWIVANDVSPATGIMGGDRNTVHLITADGVESWPDEAQGRRGDGPRRAHRQGARGPMSSPAASPSPPAARRRPAAARLPDRACRRPRSCSCGGAPMHPSRSRPVRRSLVPTGFAIALPEGFEAQVRPRSGLAAQHGVTVLNTPGTIDADYRGEIQVILINLGDEPFVVTPRPAHRPARHRTGRPGHRDRSGHARRHRARRRRVRLDGLMIRHSGSLL